MNQNLFDLISGFRGQSFVLDDIAVFFAKYLPYLLVLGFLFLVFRQRGWKKRIFLFSEGAMAVILSRGILTEIIRFFYHHPRPFDVLNFKPLVSEGGFSFPSGHAAFFFALAMSVFAWNKRWGIWYFLLAAIIGLARVFAGVHWPADVLGGAAIGILSGILIHSLLKPHLTGLYKPKEGLAQAGELS